jgi:mannose-6-phosphate isomerase-like protein (cupin superfamily)
VGTKRVLLVANESGCAITQIAVTDLKAGEVAVAHVHEDMMEGFYVMSGMLNMVLDGEVEHCTEGDFIWVRCGVRHELRAVTDVRMMTIGCAL